MATGNHDDRTQSSNAEPPSPIARHAGADRSGPRSIDASASSELDGQLGPDEISEPDELIKNTEAKRHL